jgi:hypothetical protein
MLVTVNTLLGWRRAGQTSAVLQRKPENPFDAHTKVCHWFLRLETEIWHGRRSTGNLTVTFPQIHGHKNCLLHIHNQPLTRSCYKKHNVLNANRVSILIDGTSAEGRYP